MNFPPEMLQLQRMIEAREQAIWEMELPTPAELFASAPNGSAIWENIPTSQDFPEDSWSAPAVDAKGQENSLGDLNILPPELPGQPVTAADPLDDTLVEVPQITLGQYGIALITKTINSVEASKVVQELAL